MRRTREIVRVMNLSMARGMEQHTVAYCITPAARPLDRVMVVPSGDRGECLAAVRTPSLLAFPERE